MDLLHTLKKFGICNGHIERDIEPANECTYFQTAVTGEMGRYATPMRPTHI